MKNYEASWDLAGMPTEEKQHGHLNSFDSLLFIDLKSLPRPIPA